MENFRKLQGETSHLDSRTPCMCLIITAGFSHINKTCLFHQLECCTRGRTRCFRRNNVLHAGPQLSCFTPHLLISPDFVHRRCSCRDERACSEATASAPLFTVAIIKLVLYVLAIAIWSIWFEFCLSGDVALYMAVWKMLPPMAPTLVNRYLFSFM